ncbi:MAG TPA: ATP-binding cassette domain-containing protein [Acidimicrobiales bacterium]|nr:ATP-binding cassette domain-containing protein [Acidimicrobiales bacterium]
MIEVHNLNKHFGAKLAVDNLSFQVQPGMVTGFLGPNGAGKTTTLRLILGLARPDKGTATINGVSYQGLRAPMREVGALLDAKAYHPGRKARNHLLALAQAGHIPGKRVDEVLEFVGLSDVAGRKAGTFSLGMAQRLGIAGALLGDPGVLLFDEPVNGLDPEGILWVRTLMQSLARQGRTVFVSSHLMSEMAVTASHVIVIGRGHLIADDSIEDLVQKSAGSFVRLRTARDDVVTPHLVAAGATVEADGDGSLMVSGLEPAAIGDIVFGAGVPVHELSPQEASLEEAFMELTRDDVEFHAHDHHTQQQAGDQRQAGAQQQAGAKP